MKRWFRIASLVLAATSVCVWAALGAHQGWSQNRVAEKQTDEITGIEHIVWREKWIPGVDFLALGAVCSGALLVVSLLIRPRSA